MDIYKETTEGVFAQPNLCKLHNALSQGISLSLYQAYITDQLLYLPSQ